MKSNDNQNNQSPKQCLIEERKRKSFHSYLFRNLVVDSTYNNYAPFYPWFDPEGLSEDVPERDKDFFEVELYKSGNGAKNRYYYTELLTEFFSNTFGNKVRTYNRWVLIPKSKHDDFSKIVNQYQLGEFSDFLLECICIAQEVLANDTDFWEQPENQNLKKSARSQAEDVQKIVAMFKAANAEHKKGQTKFPPQLQHIAVVFDNKTFKIDHKYLLEEIISNGFERTMAEWSDGDWEDGATAYAKSFEEYPFKNEFKFNLAMSFYQFFTEMKLFTITENESTPNDLMRCIASLIELCLVPIGNEGQSEDSKAKNIRNWIRRKM